MSTARSNSPRGFTMVELIVVMLLMGILAAVAMPRLTNRVALQEKGFRDQLKGMLQYARKVAVTQQRATCVLIVNGAPGTASVVYANAVTNACDTTSPVAEPANSQAFVASIPFGVTVSGALTMRFNARGQPVPNNNALITVGATHQLSVSRETGFVVVP